mgnify:CR=1 FL=1
MNSEKNSVFTTIGWDGERKFFAIDEHLIRLENHAIISDIEFNKDSIKNIKNKLKNKVFKEIKKYQDIKSGKPAGLVTIRVNKEGEVSITERSNKFNINCNYINAITIDAPKNLIRNKGVKYGKHLPYKNALKLAKEHDGNAALLVENNSVIDGDRGSLIVLNKDGSAWASSNKYGSIKSITLELIKEKLLKRGIPLSFGKITIDMILKSCDAIMVGTGLGVTRIHSIDKRIFEFSSSKLFETTTEIFEELNNEKWTEIK